MEIIFSLFTDQIFVFLPNPKQAYRLDLSMSVDRDKRGPQMCSVFPDLINVSAHAPFLRNMVLGSSQASPHHPFTEDRGYQTQRTAFPYLPQKPWPANL